MVGYPAVMPRVNQKTRPQRIKHVKQGVYLYVKTGPNTNEYTIATKTAEKDQNKNTELDFCLKFFDVASYQSRMFLMVHRNTGVCFSMTDDNKLQLSHHCSTPTVKNQKEYADERFFYLQYADNHAFSLQATKGILTKTNYCIEVDGNENVNIVKNTKTYIPDNLRFYFEESPSPSCFEESPSPS